MILVHALRKLPPEHQYYESIIGQLFTLVDGKWYECDDSGKILGEATQKIQVVDYMGHL